MTRGQATDAAQNIATGEGVAVYVCTKKRGRGSWIEFSAVRAKDAASPWYRDLSVVTIVRPVVTQTHPNK